jgi:hypothetical protein
VQALRLERTTDFFAFGVIRSFEPIILISERGTQVTPGARLRA